METEPFQLPASYKLGPRIRFEFKTATYRFRPSIQSILCFAYGILQEGGQEEMSSPPNVASSQTLLGSRFGINANLRTSSISNVNN